MWCPPFRAASPQPPNFALQRTRARKVLLGRGRLSRLHTPALRAGSWEVDGRPLNLVVRPQGCRDA